MPHFDKYGPYVYVAYAIAAGILLTIVVGSALRLARAKRQLEAAERDSAQPDEESRS